MKKIYMPSMDELYQMQDRGANIYKYILTKAIESIIYQGRTKPSKGMLEYAYKYLSEDPEIARAICTLYPSEIAYSETAKEDMDLCLRLIDSSKEGNKYNLDNLRMFGYDTQSTAYILRHVILYLEKELKENPRYRFEYKIDEAKRSILDDIFSGNLTEDKLFCILGTPRMEVINALVNIEPAYAVKLPIDFFSNNLYNNNEYIRIEHLHRGIANYADRYGISPTVGIEYLGKDILTNPDTQVKRLIKCIDDKNK